MDPLVHSLVHSLIHWLIRWFIGPLIGPFIDPFVGPVIGLFIEPSVDCLTHGWICFIGGFVDSLVYELSYSLANFYIETLIHRWIAASS